VAGQIILVVAPEIKTRIMKSSQEFTQRYGRNMAKIQIIESNCCDTSTPDNSNNSPMRAKL